MHTDAFMDWCRVFYPGERHKCQGLSNHGQPVEGSQQWQVWLQRATGDLHPKPATMAQVLQADRLGAGDFGTVSLPLSLSLSSKHRQSHNSRFQLPTTIPQLLCACSHLTAGTTTSVRGIGYSGSRGKQARKPKRKQKASEQPAAKKAKAENFGGETALKLTRFMTCSSQTLPSSKHCCCSCWRCPWKPEPCPPRPEQGLEEKSNKTDA